MTEPRAAKAAAITATTTNSNKINTRNQPKYQEGEKILCFHGIMIYEAKCLKVEKSTSNEYSYFIHYNGWSKNWDEWVDCKRILKYTEENLKKQQELNSKNGASLANKANNNNNNTNGNPIAGNKSQKTMTSTAAATSVTRKSAETQNNVKEENGQRNKGFKRKFDENAAKSSLEESDSSSSLSNEHSALDNQNIFLIDINEKNTKYVNDAKWSICIPQQLQEWLIDDFDLVIQQNKLLKLPSEKSVSAILNEYVKQQVNENEDCLKNKCKMQEAIAGLNKYFNVMLGSQLLYKFERIQYTQVLKMKKQMCDIYGGIHLLRLIERLKQTLLYAPLEDDSLESLVFYVNDILRYMDSQCDSLFSESNYYLAPPDYVRQSI